MFPPYVVQFDSRIDFRMMKELVSCYICRLSPLNVTFACRWTLMVDCALLPGSGTQAWGQTRRWVS